MTCYCHVVYIKFRKHLNRCYEQNMEFILRIEFRRLSFWWRKKLVRFLLLPSPSRPYATMEKAKEKQTNDQRSIDYHAQYLSQCSVQQPVSMYILVATDAQRMQSYFSRLLPVVVKRVVEGSSSGRFPRKRAQPSVRLQQTTHDAGMARCKVGAPLPTRPRWPSWWRPHGLRTSNQQNEHTITETGAFYWPVRKAPFASTWRITPAAPIVPSRELFPVQK